MKVFVAPLAATDEPEKRFNLARIAKAVGIELLDNSIEERFYLQIDDAGLVLVDREKGRFGLDFVNDALNYHRRANRGKNELIAKALGAQLGIRRILDLTAGLAQDAVFLMRLGFHVEACERNPWVYLLLAEAQQRAVSSDSKVFVESHFHFCEGACLLDKFATDHQKISVFIDPMYPVRKKVALPRKEMQIFRDLVGSDSDSTKLVEKALDLGYRRVVVKRPLKAAPLRPGPDHQYKGNTVRFDLYLGT